MASGTQTFTGKAIVTHDVVENKGWNMEEVTTRPVEDNELVVEMVATGICHTDVAVGGHQMMQRKTLPCILGHEGSGYVRAVGKNVTVAQPGDPVLLSYNSCGSCPVCKINQFSYCYSFNPLNFDLQKQTHQGKDGAGIQGSFFGQSSFANFSIVQERSVVNVKDIVTDKTELQLFSPLGCGIQTGAGTVWNVGKPSKSDIVAIIGLGGVGLSAIMAAKIAGAGTIIAIDRVEKRCELAKELGATHAINTAALPNGKTVIDAVRDLSNGHGSTITVETSGAPPLIKAGIEFTANFGRMFQVGSAPMDFSVPVHCMPFMIAGKTYRGVIEGESVASQFIPLMIQWYREGKFPVDRLVKFLPAEEFERGLHEMHTGETIKPVLLWS